MNRRIVGEWKDGPNGTYRRRRSASGKWYTEAAYTDWGDNPPPTKQVAKDPLSSSSSKPKPSVYTKPEEKSRFWEFTLLIIGFGCIMSGWPIGYFIGFIGFIMLVGNP